MGRLTRAAQFEDIIIKTGEAGQVTRVQDVARVELGARDYGTAMYLGSKPTVGMGIFQLPESNALETKAAVVRAMEALKQRFPAGLDYRVVYDTTVFVEESMAAVFQTLL